MSTIGAWISKAVKSKGLDAAVLDSPTADAIRRRIEGLYATPSASKPLWERLTDHAGVHDPEGWKLLANYPHEGRVLLFFDWDDEAAIYSAKDCTEVAKLLSECPGFVFYVTDELCGFLICHNDHDQLIGAGQAKPWVLRHHGSPDQVRG